VPIAGWVAVTHIPTWDGLTALTVSSHELNMVLSRVDPALPGRSSQ